MKLHYCPEAKQGATSAFAQGSGKLDEKPDRDGGHKTVRFDDISS